MEIKKIKIFFIVTIAIPLVLILGIFVFRDTDQFKRVGNTRYCLYYDNLTDIITIKYFDDVGWLEAIRMNGTIRDVYWDENIIVTICEDGRNNLNYYLIVMNAKKEKWHPWIAYEANSLEELNKKHPPYQFDINKMNHTDGNISWGIHW